MILRSGYALKIFLLVCIVMMFTFNSLAQGEPEKIEFPLVSEPIELTMFVSFDPTKAGGAINSYEEIACYQKMEELTNIKTKFIHPPVGQEEEKFNLMVASRNLPDVIEYDWINYPGGPEKAIQDRVIVPLNDYISKYAPNLTKLLQEYPEANRQIRTDNGTIYCFPFLRTSPNWRIILGFQLRKDWLEKLNLTTPETLEDWHNVLLAFKENDLNGNGDPDDEIPFISGDELAGLTPFLGAWGLTGDFYHVDNLVKYGPVQPEYKEFLVTMNKWYNEGLIDQEFIATDSKQFDAKVSGNVAGAWYGLLSGHLGRLTQLTRATNPDFQIAGAPVPIGPAGKSYAVHPARVMTFPGTGAAISTSNEHIKETVKYLDYGYSQEGHRLMVFGIEGKSYEMVDGVPRFTDIVKDHPDLSVDQAMGLWSRGTGSPPLEFGQAIFEGRIFLSDQHAAQAQWAKSAPDRILPPLTPTPTESREFARIMSEVETYVESMTANFIVGRQPLDNFDKYLETLKKLKIDRAVELKQAAYDRYQQRKTDL